MPIHKQKHLHKHIDKKLRNRLRLYMLISLILLILVVSEIIRNIVGFPFAFIGFCIGIVIGIVASRMFHLTWDHDAKKVISQMDIFGGVILVCYLLFSIFRSFIVGHFISGTAVGGVSLAIVAGVMIGRVLGMRGRILIILKQQNIFK